MTKYLPSDDGKVIGGKTIVWIYPPGEGPPGSAARAGKSAISSGLSKAALGKEAAASMTAAAEDGVPFCEECESARRDLMRQLADMKGEPPPAEESTDAKAAEDAKGTVKLSGTLKGPAGALKGFPFRLLCDGEPVLPGGDFTTKNGTRGKVWLTEMDGTYLFENMPSGHYQIGLVSPQGEILAEAEVKMESGDRAAPSEYEADGPVNLSGTLTSAAGPLKGFPFKLLHDGEPVLPGAGVNTKNPTRGKVWLSDSDGKYRFEGLAPGSYQVSLFSPQGTVAPDPEVKKESGVRAPLSEYGASSNPAS